jgi:PAS domain S-box-containing protein
MGRILVVDSRPNDRRHLVDLLGSAGHRFVHASDGVEALSLARSEQPDLVITEVRLSGMNIHEFVRQLRADPLLRSVPLIFHAERYDPEALILARECRVPLLNPLAEPESVLRAVDAARHHAAHIAFHSEHGRWSDSLPREQSTPHDRLAVWLDAGQRLAFEANGMRILERACQAARDLLQADNAGIGIVTSDRRIFDPYFVCGPDTSTARLPLSPRIHFFRPLLMDGRSIRKGDLTVETSTIHFLNHQPDARSFLAVPIHTGSQLYGLLWLTKKMNSEEFSEGDEQLAGRFGSLIGLAWENAQRRESVDRYRQLVEAAPVTIFIEVQGRFTFVNEAGAKLFGVNDANELLGQPVLEHFHPENRAAMAERLRTMHQEQQRSGMAEERVLRPNGVVIDVELVATPFTFEGKPAAQVVLRNVTERKRLERARIHYTQRLQTLSHRLIATQETERRHIARELHDEIGQALTAVKLNLESMQRVPAPAELLVRLEDDIALLDRTLQQVRDLSLNLRPSLLDDLGLLPALRWYMDRQAQRGGLRAHLHGQLPEMRLPPEIEITCFRVAQEALTNVLRYAQARQVRVEVCRERGELHMVIQDDGVGFDVKEALERAARGDSLGLLGMQERVLQVAGQIDIESVRHQGTTIRLRIPLASQP